MFEACLQDGLLHKNLQIINRVLDLCKTIRSYVVLSEKLSNTYVLQIIIILMVRFSNLYRADFETILQLKYR